MDVPLGGGFNSCDMFTPLDWGRFLFLTYSFFFWIETYSWCPCWWFVPKDFRFMMTCLIRIWVLISEILYVSPVSRGIWHKIIGFDSLMPKPYIFFTKTKTPGIDRLCWWFHFQKLHLIKPVRFFLSPKNIIGFLRWGVSKGRGVLLGNPEDSVWEDWGFTLGAPHHPGTQNRILLLGCPVGS